MSIVETIKVVVVGDHASDKVTLLTTYTDKKYPLGYRPVVSKSYIL